MFVPIGEWLPDQPEFQNPGAGTITNVYPRTQQSYGPVQGLSSILTALTARCQGAKGLRDSSGNGFVFAGDATKLYNAGSGASSWSNVSGATYAIGADEFWNFAQFGDNVIASNIDDGAQSFTLNSSVTFGALSASAPKWRYAAVARDFLLTGNINDTTSNGDGLRPQRVWWPAIGDPTNWPAPGSSSAVQVQSDFQDIAGDQGWLTGIVPNLGPVDWAIFFERAVFRAMYVGAPDIIGFYPAHGLRGCVAPGSIAQTEAGAIYLGPDDFYLFDGQNSVGIGYGKIAKTFYADVNQTYLGRITSTVDPVNKLYWVAYPSGASSDGTCDTILVCAYGLSSVLGTPGKWAKVTGISTEFLLRAVTFGFTLDTLDNVSTSIDALQFSLDSRIWAGGGQELLAAFDTSHTLNYFSGSNLAVTVETSEFEPRPGRRASIIRARPITDGGSPTLAPFVRNRLQDTAAATTASTVNGDGYSFFKDEEGRYHRHRITIPAASALSHIQGVDIGADDIIETGER